MEWSHPKALPSEITALTVPVALTISLFVKIPTCGVQAGTCQAMVKPWIRLKQQFIATYIYLLEIT